MRQLLPALALLIAASPLHAAGMATLDLVADGLDLPTDLTVTPDSRLLVAEKATGMVRIIENGKPLPEPFLVISDLVSRREQGLLDIAFPPDGESVYVTYTADDRNLRLSRFALAPDGSRALAETEEILLSIPDLSDGQQHYCGSLLYREGSLYLCAGDMDDHGNPSGTAQSLKDLHGKILRLDLSAEPPQAEIVAYGLRNPWNFTFDLDGNILIPDVGWNSWEELNVLPSGNPTPANFGWPFAEGNDCRLSDCRADLLWPLIELPHNGDRCAIVGGAVYDGERSPDWRGVYLFGDWCSGRMWALRDVVATPIIRQIGEGWSFISSITAGPDGELLLAQFADGEIYRITLPSDYESGWQKARTLDNKLVIEARRSGIHPSRFEFDQLKASKKWLAIHWMFDLYDTVSGW